jgi:hypothetical protein
MEAFIAILRSLAGNGWRAGLPLLFFGGSGASRRSRRVSQPGGVSRLARTLHARRPRRSRDSRHVNRDQPGRRDRPLAQTKNQRRDEAKAVLSNLETLRGQEITFLFAVLSSPQQRFEIYQGSEESALLTKKIIVAKDFGHHKFICELHPAVLAHRDRLLPVLKAIIESGDPHASLTWSPSQSGTVIPRKPAS